MKTILAIALLAGAASGGIVWFGWAFVRNALSARRRASNPAASEAKERIPVRAAKTKN